MTISIRLFAENPYILVDPCAGGETALNGVQGTYIRHPRVALGDEFLPRVLDARQLTDAQRGEGLDYLQSLQDSALSGGIVGVLASAAEGAELAAHLALQSVRQLGEFGRQWVRIWDAQVLMHLLWIWPAAELQRLFGPIERWCLPLPAELVTVERSQLNGEGLPQPADRHRALMDMGIINAALAAVPWRFADVARLGPEMVEAIRHARQACHLHDETDLALFAQQACRWRAGFTDHPDIAAALALTRDGETRYRDALAQIDDARMQRIEAELSA